MPTQFELVAPESRLASEQTEMVVIPAESGDMGVLEGHAPVVASLVPGVVRLYNRIDAMEPVKKYFVGGGFADVSQERCAVLAEDCQLLEDLDPSAIRQNLAYLEEDLGVTQDERDRARLQDKIRREYAKLAAIGETE